jgi:transposase InsO family protein
VESDRNYENSESCAHSINSSEDDINENTDTEDGGDELIDLIGANTRLIAFIAKQRETLARLRRRITRMKRYIERLTTRMNEFTAGQYHEYANKDPEDTASVLMDDAIDTSLLVKPEGEVDVQLDIFNNAQIRKELEQKLNSLQNVRDSELWMYFDSGASRSVISTESPIRKHLKEIIPAYGSCSVGNGTPLQYIETGKIQDNMEITVVADLKYDLFSSVNAAKQGLTSIIDYDLKSGKNNSYTIDKITGAVTPLIERGKGILELPLHLMIPRGKSLTVTSPVASLQAALPPNIVSMFWHCYDDTLFDPATRENNQTDYSLFTFDILKSLNERERNFLIHARLGHLPRQKILQMIKNGTTGITDYSGKFKELCKPCFQAKQRAEDHGKEHQRHPNGRPGEHLHSDLAVLSTVDLNGNKYVLTVVDEVSQEIVIALLRNKTAAEVCRVCKKIQMLISARTRNKLLTWQFDRGTEFLNSTFEQWLKLELGVTQRFSNIEHPWENGKAERSFQTLFALSRSLLKHADLPDRLWGKAILHSVYLVNRSPTAALGGIAPLQFRTQEPIDLTHLRVFGSPAQIFVRTTIRDDNKLSDRSVSGTFVGMSDKGDGYIFLIGKSNKLVQIDSKDAKFNETFSDYRARQGRLSPANHISPDLQNESESDEQPHGDKQVRFVIPPDADDNSRDIDDDKHGHGRQHEGNDPGPQRQQRQTTPRDFLLPGTYAKELEIRRMGDANLCVENSMDEHDPIYLLQCMEAQTSDESRLMKEMELLNACTYGEDDKEFLLSTLTGEINLSVPDPKSQREIDCMNPTDAKDSMMQPLTK